jgi:ribonuclease HI
MLSDGKEILLLIYLIDKKHFVISSNTYLANTMRKFQLQLGKVLKSAIKGQLEVGQTIHCVFIENFNFLKETDYQKYIRVDRRKGLDIITSETPMIDSYKLYADGSYANKTQQSGYGGFIEAPDGTQEIFHRSFNNGNSNLMELLAVMEGLQRLEPSEIIQVNTDSRFVIRGLVQWVHFWKHNNWQMAYGREVKFANYWQQIDQLCEGKRIEFKWIKGHSGNEKQDFCHQLASECTNRSLI